MPCWQVQTMSVEFKAAHADLLEQALKAERLRYTYDRRSQVITINPGDDWTQIKLDLNAGTAQLREDLQPTLNAIKRAYSTEAVKQLAKKNGWKVQLNGTNKLKGQFLKGVL